MPFFIIGIEKSHYVFYHALGSIAETLVVVHIGSHVTLGQFLLASVLAELHKLSYVHIFGSFEAEISEKHQVRCKAGEPLFTANDMSRTHEMVVNGIGKMICRYTVGFEKHDILIAFGNFKVAAYKIGDLYTF